MGICKAMSPVATMLKLLSILPTHRAQMSAAWAIIIAARTARLTLNMVFNDELNVTSSCFV